MKKYRIYAENHFPIDMNIIHTAEDDGYELTSFPQEYNSARTSINSKQLPAIYKMVSFHPGDVAVDYGGGKFDNAIEYLKDKDVTLCVYDPYNRSSEHNSEVLKILKQNGGADAAVCSNVLNVIKEPEARKDVLKNISKITKSGAPVYITVYEGSGKGNEGPTKSGYQLNRKTESYLQEIQEVFPDATRKGKLIVAHNKSVTGARRSRNSVASSKRITAAYDSYIQVNNLGVRYSIHYTGLPGVNTQNPSPEDDEKAFRSFKAQITVISPYDNADYYWAKILGNGKIQYIYKGRVKDEGQYTSPNQEYESLTEWMDNVCNVAEEALHDYNRNIERRIVTNSKKLNSRKKLIKADVDLDSQDIMNEISNDVQNRLLTTLMNEFGYSEEGAKDYSSVEVWRTTYDGENYYSVGVEAELDFDDLMELADALNPEVEQWDPDAYFDAEDSGRLFAMINAENARQEYINSCDQSSAIMSAYPNPPEPRLDPPEDYAWEDGFIQEELDIGLVDQYITIDEDGDVTWDDDSFTDADSSDGWWYSDELYDCRLDDGDGVFENLMDVLYPQLSYAPGRYSLSGTAHLFYDVNYQYTADPDAEGRYLDRQDGESIDPSSYEVNFNFSSSWVEGLTCTEL